MKHLITIAVLLTLFAAQSRADNALPGRPNIVVIMVDDLDMLTLNTMRENNLMPYFEQYIAGKAINFTESFVTDSLCCPSRATFLSGLYGHNHKTYGTAWPNGGSPYFEEASALPVWLEDVGYVTGHVGKYLNAYGYFSLYAGTPQLATERALWDIRIGQTRRLRLEATYIPPGWSEWYGLLDPFTYCVYDYSLNENGAVRTYRQNGSVWSNGLQLSPAGTNSNPYQTNLLASRATSFIQRNAISPFFLSVSPLTPHVEQCAATNAIFGTNGPTFDEKDFSTLYSAIIRPPPQYASYIPAYKSIASAKLNAISTFNEPAYGDKPAELRANRLSLTSTQIDGIKRQFAYRMAAMRAVDDLIGAIGTQLTTSGVANNTIIVFTSDNGWFYGQHRLSNKMLAYEEAIRVPLFVTLPSIISAQTSSKTIINNDYAPTLAALVGAVPPRTLDGRSFVPFLVNPSSTSSWRKRFLISHYVNLWDDEDGRSSSYSSFRAVRTTAEATGMMNRLHVGYYSGMQYHYMRQGSDTNGYFATKPAFDSNGVPTTTPIAGNVLSGTRIDEEMYYIGSDPLQEVNLLTTTRGYPPPTSRMISDRTTLRAYGAHFVVCFGTSCHTLETN